MEFKTAKLDNGLTVIGEVRSTAVSAALGFFVKTGARDETQELLGVSHFLEHMVFKGTERRSALDVTYQLAAIGAQANAFTSEEQTVYYAQIVPEYFEPAIDLLADMMRPALFQADFDTEKKVILEEIALYQDRPTHVLFETALKEFFTGHVAGNPVLGTHESVSALTSEQMKSYFEKRYSASNITLVVAGDVDWNRALDLASKYCSSWPAHQVSRNVPVHNPLKRALSLKKKDLQTAHSCLIGPGPSSVEEERYAAQVLSCVLGDGHGSKAFWELVDKGLAEAAFVDSDDMDNAGFIYGYVAAEPERLPEVTDKLRSIMSKSLEFTDEELQRALTKLKTRLVLQGESSMRRLMAVGLEWLARGRYRTLDEELQRLGSVTRGEIGALVEKYPLIPTTEVQMLPE